MPKDKDKPLPKVRCGIEVCRDSADCGYLSHNDPHKPANKEFHTLCTLEIAYARVLRSHPNCNRTFVKAGFHMVDPRTLFPGDYSDYNVFDDRYAEDPVKKRKKNKAIKMLSSAIPRRTGTKRNI